MGRFETLAPQWDDDEQRIALSRAVADAVRAALPLAPDWRILDFCAATGLVTLRLIDHVAEVIAMDRWPAMLAELDRRFAAAGLTQVSTHWVDLTRGAWDGPPLDAVVSWVTMHEIEDVPAVLARLVQALRPGGWLAVADLDAEDGSFHGPDATGVFHRGFARETMAAWLAEAGCVEVTVRDAHQIVQATADGTPRAYGVFLAVGRRP